MSYILDILEDRVYSSKKSSSIFKDLKNNYDEYLNKSDELLEKELKHNAILSEKHIANANKRSKGLGRIEGTGSIIGAVGGTALGGGISYLATRKLREKIKANEEELRKNGNNYDLLNQVQKDKRKLKLILLGGSTAGLIGGSLAGNKIAKSTKAYKRVGEKHDAEEKRLNSLSDNYKKSLQSEKEKGWEAYTKQNNYMLEKHSKGRIAEFQKALDRIKSK